MGWKSYLLPLWLRAAAGLEQSDIARGSFIVEYEEPRLGVMIQQERVNCAKCTQLLSSVLDMLDVVKVLDFDYDVFKGATV